MYTSDLTNPPPIKDHSNMSCLSILIIYFFKTYIINVSFYTHIDIYKTQIKTCLINLRV